MTVHASHGFPCPGLGVLPGRCHQQRCPGVPLPLRLLPRSLWGSRGVTTGGLCPPGCKCFPRSSPRTDGRTHSPQQGDLSSAVLQTSFPPTERDVAQDNVVTRLGGRGEQRRLLSLCCELLVPLFCLLIPINLFFYLFTLNYSSSLRILHTNLLKMRITSVFSCFGFTLLIFLNDVFLISKSTSNVARLPTFAFMVSASIFHLRNPLFA